MSKDEMSFEELAGLEQRLRRAEATGTEEESLGRVLRKVQAHVNTTPAPASRRWGRRISMFAVVGIPVAAAAAIAGIVLFNANPRRAVVPAPATTPSPEPSATVAPPPGLLVVLTQRANGNPGSITVGVAPDTVILARLDGTVVARATFKPATQPLITNAATILPAQVHAAAGAAYYIDGDGTVRRLDRTGAMTTVASFPTTEPQHMTSFAVSPDGGKIMATVLTFGAKGPGLPGPITVGPSYNNLEIADAGGATTVLSHTTQNTTSLGQFAVAGWDQGGPLGGAIPIATQNPLPEGWGAPLFHLSLDGKSGDQLGGAGCVAEVENPAAQVLCSTASFARAPIQVRTSAGALVWALPSTAGSWGSVALSPSGDQLAAGPLNPPGGAPQANHVYFQDGSQATLPTDFFSLGWWDEQTLVGYSGNIDSPVLATIPFTGHQPGSARPLGNNFYAGFIPQP